MCRDGGRKPSVRRGDGALQILGWEEVEVKSERVMDRRALFGALSGWHGESMMVKSVKVYRQSSEKGVEVLDYVEGGLL